MRGGHDSQAPNGVVTVAKFTSPFGISSLTC